MRKSVFFGMSLFAGIALISLLIILSNVRVGPTSVSTSHSLGYVVFNNLIGDVLGYDRCILSGTSLYWSEDNEVLAREKKLTDSEFLSDSGHIVSSFGVIGLKKIANKYHERIAYQVAQEVLVNNLIKNKQYDGIERLEYPLRFWKLRP